jgi:hypothetical protein
LDNSIPVPTAIVDSEYKLTADTYRRILYASSWNEKDTLIQKYCDVIDAQRDANLQHTSDVTYQCVTRHSTLQRQTQTDVVKLQTSQILNKKLHEQNLRLNKANACLKNQNTLISNKAKKVVHFDTDNTNSSPKKSRPGLPKKTPTPRATARISATAVTKTAVRARHSPNNVSSTYRASPTPKPQSTTETPTTPVPALQRPTTAASSDVSTPDSSAGNNDSDCEFTQEITAPLDDVNTTDDIDVSDGGDSSTEDETPAEYAIAKAQYLAELNLTPHRSALRSTTDDRAGTEQTDEVDEFQFDTNELSDCGKCVHGSGRKIGHSGRHTTTLRKGRTARS